MFEKMNRKYDDGKDNREETFVLLHPTIKHVLMQAEAHAKPVDKQVKVDNVSKEAIKAISKEGGVSWF